ncbi:MAG: glucoamylase family protein [Bacilli bacterium]
MKKNYPFVLLTLLVVSCTPTTSSSESSSLTSSELALLPAKEALFTEQEKSFRFFWETTTTSSNGFGLSRDRWPGNPTIASIASVGFALSSMPLGVENGWITRAEGEARVLGTLNTLKSMTRIEGFYYHWVNMATGAREWNSEISIIDTGLMLAGAIVAAEYFGGEIAELVEELYLDVNWDWYVNPARKMFYMSYKPGVGHSGAWDHFAEQMILYVLAAGNPRFTYGAQLYQNLRTISTLNNNYVRGYTSIKTKEVVQPFIYSYDGSLFQHQFSHAFIDFRGIVDDQGIDWFENARRATRANYLFTQDFAHRYKTYSEISWGISAGDGPNEYRAYGSQPAKNNAHNGTIVPYAAVASINYWEYESLMATLNYASISQLKTTYGFADAYNLGPVDPAYNQTIANLTPWYDPHVLGIDKGITALMIENYRSELIWDMFMANDFVQTGLATLGFENR